MINHKGFFGRLSRGAVLCVAPAALAMALLNLALEARPARADLVELVRADSPPTSVDAAGSLAPVVRKAERTPSAAKPSPVKRPCKARDEGSRPLVQGSGTVRTWTFCG